MASYLSGVPRLPIKLSPGDGNQERPGRGREGEGGRTHGDCGGLKGHGVRLAVHHSGHFLRDLKG